MGFDHSSGPAKPDREAVLQQARAESSDFVEGVLAFLQKRPATFNGA
jgi:enoyl-CoA hydratase/carnithine racemase